MTIIFGTHFAAISVVAGMIGVAGLMLGIRVLLDLRDMPHIEPNVVDE